MQNLWSVLALLPFLKVCCLCGNRPVHGQIASPFQKLTVKESSNGIKSLCFSPNFSYSPSPLLYYWLFCIIHACCGESMDPQQLARFVPVRRPEASSSTILITVRNYIEGRYVRLKAGSEKLGKGTASASLCSDTGAKKSIQEKIGNPNLAKSFSKAAFTESTVGNLLLLPN